MCLGGSLGAFFRISKSERLVLINILDKRFLFSSVEILCHYFFCKRESFFVTRSAVYVARYKAILNGASDHNHIFWWTSNSIFDELVIIFLMYF